MGKNDIVNKVDENKTNPAMKVLMYAFLIFWALVNIFPIYFMFTFSLKSNEEIFGKNVIGLPENWLWSNYTTALNTGSMGLYFVNSLIVTISALSLSGSYPIFS